MDDIAALANAAAPAPGSEGRTRKRTSMSDINDRADYLTDEHLTWLVESRAHNQQSALDLHNLINEYEAIIQSTQPLRAACYSLVGINFSLWRAVFLSDLYDGGDHMLRDARSFLKNLIANNMVAYPQDRGAREWTFVYYVENAEFRLNKLTESDLNVLPKDQLLDTPNANDKLWWNECQISLDRAIINLRDQLASWSLSGDTTP